MEAPAQDEFIAKYGDCEELDSADFDFVSKVGEKRFKAARGLGFRVWGLGLGVYNITLDHSAGTIRGLGVSPE